MADPPTGKLLNVVQEIKADHDRVRELYNQYKASTNRDEKVSLVKALVREITIHSDAEEASIYQHFESWGLGNAAERNKEEHVDIRRLTQAAGEANITQSDYNQVVNRAVTAFLEHADKVEKEQLTKIEQNLTAQQSDDAAKEFLKHRKTSAVPSRP